MTTSKANLERAWNLGVKLGLDRHRGAIADAMQEAADEAVEEAVRAKVIELTTHPALVCCHQAHLKDQPIGLCRSCKQRVQEMILAPAVAEALARAESPETQRDRGSEPR